MAVWDHLSVTGPHLIYLILGGFTSLFMLCSTVIKERMYIGEATVATLCGVIFGPHAANVIDPTNQWSSVDIITIEFSRVVLVVQCFAVGVELPKFYMERHWKSVTLLLVPVMLFGWLVTSLFVWWMVPALSWIESLVVAACVTATDPVLASSVVGKGKFAKRIPKHLRDLLSAESGCNDGMAFPFVYLALYLIHDKLNAKEVTKHWFLYTILYECIFGAIYGFAIGYLARHGIKYAERHDLIDRESFLVFYFVLALFAAGSGSILGIDDLLVGFAAGVGFSNDGWFTQKTEESHVSNVIDLLINLAYFVYFGTIIPWPDFNDHEIGLYAWRLVVLALLVIFFRRIPIMLALKPIIPDIKSWREALFAGHFGPIGVGAIFIAMLARAELETESPIPLTKLPDPGTPHYTLIRVVWPIVAFLVVASIIVHGSSVAVFTLGKHINTLSITMSYTQANEDGPTWMTRLPRITSTSRSQARTMSDTEVDEYKMPEYPPGTLPPIGYPGNFLRRVKEDDKEKSSSRHGSRASSLVSKRRRKKWDDGIGPGGPITQSAIFPQRRSLGDPLSPIASPVRESSDQPRTERLESSPVSPVDEGPSASPVPREQQHGSGEGSSKTVSPRLSGSPTGDERRGPVEVYDEGDNIVIENRDGDVLAVHPSHGGNAAQHAEELKSKLQSEAGHSGWGYDAMKKRVANWRDEEIAKRKENEKTGRKGEPARAYQFGTTIIVENEDGDVVKKYELPAQKAQASTSNQAEASDSPRPVGLSRWASSAFGRTHASEASPKKKAAEGLEEDDDKQVRFTIGGVGRRMTKDDFIHEVQKLDKSTRREVVDKSSASQALKTLAKQDPQAEVESPLPSAVSRKDYASTQVAQSSESSRLHGSNNQQVLGAERSPRADSPGKRSDSPEKRPTTEGTSAEDASETAAERRRRLAALQREKSDETGDEDAGETAAERRRREAALGMASPGAEEDSDDDDTPRVPPSKRAIRFADVPDRGRK